MTARLGWRIGVSLFTALSLPVLRAAEPYEGRPVSSIRFTPAAQPLTLEQLKEMLPIHIGQPLSDVQVRQAIQRLFATGEYADIAVNADIEDGSVALTFETKPNRFVGLIRVTPVPEPPSDTQLLVSARLQPGTEFQENDLRQAVEGMEDVLRRNGYYGADVEPRTVPQPAFQQTDIDFDIQAGQRARFDGITVSGNPERPLPDIVKSTGWRGLMARFKWRPVTEARIQSGLDNLRRWYDRRNHLLARVTLLRLEYHPTTNTVTPSLVIESGPDIDVRVQGAKIPRGTLQKLLPIYQEHSVDRELLDEGNRDLTDYLQSQGFFNAQVTWDSSGNITQGTETIVYRVASGLRKKLVKVDIEGNHYFDTPTIRERMIVTPASLFEYPRGRFSSEYLDRDLNTIRDLYRTNGFRDVEVSAQELDDYSGRARDVAILIRIDEGPQWTVSKLDLEGVSDEDRPDILKLIQSSPGQPYSDVIIAADRDNILDFYYNRGYPSAKFDASGVEANSESHTVALTFAVTPGPRRYVRNVIISGLERTKPEVVNSRVSLKSGQPLSESEITDTQRRLYDLGIFSRVDTAIQNPEGDEPTKNVLFLIEEAARYTISFGFGAEFARIGGSTTNFESPAGAAGFSPRVTFGVDRINFMGLAHTIGLQTLLSTLEQRALASYTIPQLQGNRNLNLQFTALFDISHNVRTFSSRTEEGSVQIGQRLSTTNTVQYRYVFRQVNILGTPLITPELIPLLSQPERVGLIGGSFIRDRRDDPIDAHTGSYTTIDLGLAAKALGSETGFGRVVARNATYYRLSKTLVLARSSTFGAIERYSGLAEIPLAERFFSGGASSHRAFPDFQAGPRDLVTGFPIGGDALLLNTVELRFPIAGDRVGGVLFNDIGNVYSDLTSISLRFRQRNLQDFDYGVHAYGFGIRYRTPVGPIRVDLSLSPNSPYFLGFQGTRDQLLYGGGTPNVLQRINIFQFHISLGQAF